MNPTDKLTSGPWSVIMRRARWTLTREQVLAVLDSLAMTVSRSAGGGWR